MNRFIAGLIGGCVHQPYEGKAMTAHITSTDLSQIYVAATWVGTVELAIVAAVGFGLWFWERKFAQRIRSPPARSQNLEEISSALLRITKRCRCCPHNRPFGV